MAFLLLMYEKMRLQRKVNKLTVRQMSLGRKQDRIEKNIERVQKMYSKRESSLENYAKRMTNCMSTSLRSIMGLGVSNFNLNSYSSSALINDYISKQSGLSDEKVNAFINYNYTTDSNDSSGKTVLTQEEYNKLCQARTQAQQIVSAQQSQASMVCNEYENNVSIWLEAAKEQLEAEQDEALGELEAEQTDIELDLSSCETQLETARARLESVKSACSQEAKDSAPKFGLG